MVFPSKVKVGHADFKIERWNPKDAFSSNRAGECCRITEVIRIDESLSTRQAAAVLVHEIMHAIWWTFSYDYLRGIPDDKDREEPYVSALSSGLATVMRDNPDVFEWVHCALKGD